jgi:hypothetical protein
MLRVTIELLSAITGRTSKIGEMYIANDGERSVQDSKLGDYIVAVQNRKHAEGAYSNLPRELFGDFDHWSKDALARHPKAARTGTVKEYPRLAYNVWRLITRACLAAFPEECSSVQNTKRKGIAPTLDAQVMRGLHLLSASGIISDNEDVVAARAWLDAAKSEAYPNASDNTSSGTLRDALTNGEV